MEENRTRDLHSSCRVKCFQLHPNHPLPLRRDLVVKRIEELPGGVLVFTVRSYNPAKAAELGLETTEEGDRHPCYDQETGLVWCSCPGFQLVKARLAAELDHYPTLLTPHYQCKHLRHVVAALWQAGRVRRLALLRALWYEQAYGELPKEMFIRANEDMGP